MVESKCGHREKSGEIRTAISVSEALRPFDDHVLLPSHHHVLDDHTVPVDLTFSLQLFLRNFTKPWVMVDYHEASLTIASMTGIPNKFRQR